MAVCKHCQGKCIKNGRQRNGSVRYKCTVCHKKQQEEYVYNAYQNQINDSIKIYVKEGVGIRSTSRILKIAAGTVLKRIILIAKKISQPILSIEKTYEVDEIRTAAKSPLLGRFRGVGQNLSLLNRHSAYIHIPTFIFFLVR